MSLKAEDGGCAVSTRLLTVQHHLGAVYKNIPRSRSPSQHVTPHRSSNQRRWLTLHHLNAPAEPHKLWHTEVFRLQGTCDDNVAPAPVWTHVNLLLLWCCCLDSRWGGAWRRRRRDDEIACVFMREDNVTAVWGKLSRPGTEGQQSRAQPLHSSFFSSSLTCDNEASSHF